MTNVQHDAYICQQYLTDELNDRIFNRYFPTQTLEPMFEFRAVNTREETMPIFDCRKKSNIPLTNHGDFDTLNVYNPGYRGPLSGYCKNVDVETKLRNTIFPIQKGNDQGKYIPGTGSDLYNLNHVPLYAPTPLEKLAPHDPNKCKIATAIFDNHTRQQTKNIDLEQVKKSI